MSIRPSVATALYVLLLLSALPGAVRPESTEHDDQALPESTDGVTVSPSDGPDLQIDHVILAVADLETGMREFEERTGVRPIHGGRHPDRDTHNAIVPMPGGLYVEILAPRDDLDAIPEFFADLQRLTPVGFAISTRTIDQLERSVRARGLETRGIQSGSRTTPDGDELAWHLLLIDDAAAFMNPFFITWSDDSQHPSRMQPPQCELGGLTLTTPVKDDIAWILTHHGGSIDGLTLVEGSKRLTLDLETPKGRMTFAP